MLHILTHQANDNGESKQRVRELMEREEEELSTEEARLVLCPEAAFPCLGAFEDCLTMPNGERSGPWADNSFTTILGIKL